MLVCAVTQVPRDSDSELDICSFPEGLPPVLQPSRLGNPALAAASRDHDSAISQPASMLAQAGASEPAAAAAAEQPGTETDNGAPGPALTSMPAGALAHDTAAEPATRAPAEQPGDVTAKTPADDTAPAGASTATQAAPVHLSTASAAAAPPMNMEPGALQQNGVPGLLAAAGLTGLLAVDPNMLAAIAAGASQFLLQAPHLALGLVHAPVAAALPATAPSVQSPLSQAPAHPQPPQVASQQEPDQGPPQQHEGDLQQLPDLDLDPPQAQPIIADSHQAPPDDIGTNGVSESAPAVRMLGRRAKTGAVLDSVVLPPKPAAKPAPKPSSPFLDGVKREMAAHIQQHAADQEGLDVTAGAAGGASAAELHPPLGAPVASGPAHQSGAAGTAPMEITAAVGSAPQQEAAVQLPAADAAPLDPGNSNGAAVGDRAIVLGAREDGARLESPPASPPLTLEGANALSQSTTVQLLHHRWNLLSGPSFPCCVVHT